MFWQAHNADTAGNLVARRGERAVLTEHFYYDALNRLDYSTLASPVFSGTNLDLAYDAAGNITNKTGVGGYRYESTRSHALTHLDHPDGSADTFLYDANGNLTSGAGKTVTWTSYNYLASVTRGGNTVTFQYGPDRQRVQESGPGYTRTTVNAYFEKVEEGSSTTYKHFIRAGAKVVAVHDRKSNYEHTTHYLLRDHLGSVDTITDEDGNVVARMSFDAFGQRRLATNWNDGFPTGTALDDIREVTTRGYTGHQMIDATNLIHMNGRIYNPELGRFLSPDPNIPNPYNTQSYNRYSYVYNNPLSFTDPSGFVAEAPSTNECATDSKKCTPEQRREIRVCQQNNGDYGCAMTSDGEVVPVSQLSSDVQDALKLVRPGTFVSNIPVTREQREMLAAGDLAGFWRSRASQGDPWAEDGLALWDPNNPAVSDEAATAAALLKAKVYAAMVVRNGEALSLDQFSIELQKIGIEIAYQHVAATDRIAGGVVGLGAGARYHHVAFKKFGLPPTTYGATLVEPAPWNVFWSYEAQARFVNEYMYEYCDGCPD